MTQDKTKIYCPYCKSERDTDMNTKYIYAQLNEGWYGDVEFECCDATIDISCSNCKKLLYSKEITINADRY